MRALILILVMALVVFGLAGDGPSLAWAAEDETPRAGQAPPDSEDGSGEAPGNTLGEAGAAYCGAVARQCGRDCQASTEPGSAASAACEARCAVDRAACDARDTLSRVEPWLDDQATMVDRFMDGFETDPERGTIDPDAGPPTREACRGVHDQCMTRCATRFDDDYARAGCESVCALDRATCETAAGIETARPLIEREARRLQDFFDALRGGGETPPPPPSPSPPLDDLGPDGGGVLDI